MGKDYLGEDQRRTKEDKDEKEIKGKINYIVILFLSS